MPLTSEEFVYWNAVGLAVHSITYSNVRVNFFDIVGNKLSFLEDGTWFYYKPPIEAP